MAQNRDQLGGTRLQHEANDQDHGCARHVAGHRGLNITKFLLRRSMFELTACHKKPAPTSFYTASAVKRLSRIPTQCGHSPAKAGEVSCVADAH
jgi:hypothetical protein